MRRLKSREEEEEGRYGSEEKAAVRMRGRSEKIIKKRGRERGKEREERER
jgi:hypothetical protein